MIWRLEWLRAWRRRRLFIFNVAIPLMLVLPISLSSAPSVHAAAVYTVLFALFGTFGAAIPVLRDGERGIMRRVGLGTAPANVITARALVGGCIDALQLLPALLVILVVKNSFDVAAVWLLAATFVSLIIANFVGLWLAALARSVAEGALFAAIATLLLLHASGVFRTPQPGSLGERIEFFAPYRALHEALLTSSQVHQVALFAWLVGAVVVSSIAAKKLLGALASLDGRS